MKAQNNNRTATTETPYFMAGGERQNGAGYKARKFPEPSGWALNWDSFALDTFNKRQATEKSSR